MSIVIPAHDEADVIDRTLASVLEQDHVGPMEVLVVANGCADDTVAVAARRVADAQARGWTLRAIEIEERGKANALNVGDAAATGEVRIYLDADVTISPTTVSGIVAALEREGIELAAPALAVVLPHQRLVRGYVQAWSRLPYVRDGVAGRGVYGVSAIGRARWAEFPMVRADDSFARLHFGDDEVAIIADASVEVRFPESWREMVAVRARLFLGMWELRDRYPELTRHESSHARIAARVIARHPDLWRRAPAFLAVYGLGLWRARRTARLGDAGTWERAQSSRTAGAEST